VPLIESGAEFHSWGEFGYLYGNIHYCSREVDMAKLPEVLRRNFNPELMVIYEMNLVDREVLESQGSDLVVVSMRPNIKNLA
jgi:hypothetical protein